MINNLVLIFILLLLVISGFVFSILYFGKKLLKAKKELLALEERVDSLKADEQRLANSIWDKECIENELLDRTKDLEVIKETINSLLKKEEDIKATIAAGIAAQVREQEMAEKEQFYTVQIKSSCLTDLKILKEVEDRLSPAGFRALKMSIWTSFYSKPVNELCGRVLGSKPVSGIYKITDLITKKSYIGQAVDIKERWRQHCKCGLGIDTPVTNKLYAAMLEHGLSNFTFELIEACDKTSLNKKEKQYIEIYSADTLGLNSTKGNK